jgi:hypothetical protein
VYESLTGKLGLSMMSANNPMKGWDGKQANIAFDRMQTDEATKSRL